MTPEFDTNLLSEEALRIIRNFLSMMPKTYRRRTPNWIVVRDIILTGTHTAGCTSCMKYCREIEIDPDAYEIGELS